MPHIDYKKECCTTCDAAYKVVKDFESYPEFLPWCSAARLIDKKIDRSGNETFIADLIISFKVFNEKFTTRVTCDRENYNIDIDYIQGPFKHLKGKWSFVPVAETKDKIIIHFSIDFEFKSFLLQKMIGFFFEEAMRRIIDAFEQRLQENAANK